MKTANITVEQYCENHNKRFIKGSLYITIEDERTILYCTKTSNELYGFVLESEKFETGDNNNNKSWNENAFTEFHGKVTFEQE